MRRTCPSQLHLLSRAFIHYVYSRISGFFLDGSARDRREHLDAVPLSLRFTFSVIFQDSQPYSRVDTTEAWKDVAETFDTLDAAKMYLRFYSETKRFPRGENWGQRVTIRGLHDPKVFEFAVCLTALRLPVFA